MSKSSDALAQMIRLYMEEELSLEQVGKRFQVTRQAVHERFKRAGIKLRPKSNRQARKTFERDVLSELYEEKQLNIGQIAKKLGAGFAKVSAELDRHNIPKRAVNYKRRKHPELWEMKIGDTLIVPRPPGRKPYSTLYGMAKYAQKIISIKSISAQEIRITCRGNAPRSGSK